MKRQLLAWGGAVGMLAAAWGLGVSGPSSTARTDAFFVSGVVGEPVQARTFEITVHDVTITERITQTFPSAWAADGTWVVVEVDVTALQKETDPSVGYARLLVGDRIFRSSAQPTQTLASTSLTVDVPTRAQTAFRVPADLSGPALLQFGASKAYPVGDSLVEIPIDLDEAERTSDLDLMVPEILGVEP